MPFETGGAQLIALILIMAVYALPIYAVLWIVRSLRAARRPDPAAILATRLSRGEITREEFDTAMRALGLGDAGR